MAEQRAPEFTVLLRFPGKDSIKIMFYDAVLWADRGGHAGLYRLKVCRQPGGAIRFSEAWHGGALNYEFLTPHQAWRLVGELGCGVETLDEEPLPDLPPGTAVRVPNGRVLDGQTQYDITRTATRPVRLSDGRASVVVMMIGRGAVHVPLDTIEILGRTS